MTAGDFQVCWCHAVWGLSVVATRTDQGGGSICEECASRSPSACKNVHMAEALRAARGV